MAENEPSLSSSNPFAQRFLRDLLQDHPHSKHLIQTRLQGKMISLENPKRKDIISVHKKNNKNKNHPVYSPSVQASLAWNRTTRHDLNKTINDEQIRNMQSLNGLWEGYVSELNAGKCPPASKWIKMDYHASRMKVIQSSCPSLVGVEGLVLQERANVFVLLTDDVALLTTKKRIKMVPKKGSVFECVWRDHHVIRLYGNQLCYKSEERVVRKFKNKASIDL